jgi:hypothetical protein
MTELISYANVFEETTHSNIAPSVLFSLDVTSAGYEVYDTTLCPAVFIQMLN